MASISRFHIARFIFIPATLFLCLAIPTAAAQDTAPPAAQDQAPPAAQDPAAPDDAPPGERQPRRIQIDLAQVLAQARAAARDGKLREAVRLYQLILRFMPNSRVARIELSFALTRLGERDRAARLLRDVDKDGLPPELIATIDRIVGPDRLNFFLIPEIIIDSNINGQTKKSAIPVGGVCCLTLQEDAKGRAAYGYGVTLGATYRLLDAAPRTSLTLGTRVQDVNARQDDKIDLFGSLSFAFQGGQKFVFTPSLSGAYRTRADAEYEREHAGGLSIGFPIGPVRAGLSGRYRMVEGIGDFKNRRDRRRSEVNGSFRYGFSSIGLRLDGGLFREDWDQMETQDNDGYKTGLDITFVDMLSWAMPTIGGSFTRTDYENEAAFFGVRRHDRDYEGHIDLELRDFKLFGRATPTLTYRYRHETSTIPLVEYDKHEFSVGFKAITF